MWFKTLLSSTTLHVRLSLFLIGLLQVFSQISPDTGLPDPVAFTKGVALALSATVIGLCIAIPSLVGSGYLQRKIENYAAQLDVLLERILQRTR